MILSYIVTFVCAWWLVFYMTLPFAVKRIKPNKKGHDSGAPQKTYLEIKMIITTIIAGLITWWINYITESGLLKTWISNYINWLHDGL